MKRPLYLFGKVDVTRPTICLKLKACGLQQQRKDNPRWLRSLNLH